MLTLFCHLALKSVLSICLGPNDYFPFFSHCLSFGTQEQLGVVFLYSIFFFSLQKLVVREEKDASSANCELRRKWKEWLGGVKRCCSLLPFLYTLHFTGFFIEESLRTVIFLLFYYFINIRHKDYFISKKRGRVVVNLYTGHNVFFMWLRHIYMAV